MPVVADVSGEPRHAGEVADGQLQHALPACVDDEVPPALGQAANERETEPAGGAGDDPDPAHAAAPRATTRS